MIPLTCGEAQELLQAFHDEELPLDLQIAVEQHLDGCAPCTWELRRLAAIGEGLRGAATELKQAVQEPASLQAKVLSQIEAERNGSFIATLRRNLEDLHLVWAALGGTAAASVCVAAIFALLYYASPGRADSLAGVLSVLSSPGSNENPMRLDNRIQLPRVYPDHAVPAILIAPSRDAEDDLFALAAVLTREGRLIDLEVLLADDGHDRQELTKLLDAVSAARFEPARFRDAPIAVNVVWLLARTTVRATS
jgi:hypothetical protein